MKPLTIVGLVLILVGILGYATGGLTFTHRHTDIDSGPIEVSHDQRTLIPLSPYLSTIALVAGIGMLICAPRSR
jgi:hypothetical protein